MDRSANEADDHDMRLGRWPRLASNSHSTKRESVSRKNVRL